jgi:hypothetical protein
VESVCVVASTPTTLDCVVNAAGLTAGSMPMIGRSKRERSVSIAAPVAVLQATTIALARWLMRN